VELHPRAHRPLTALSLDAIVKRFGGVTALDGATLDVAPGTVHALLGENGAGKTTLMRVAFGLLRPDAGTIAIDGHRVTLRSPADAIAHGVGMVQQHFSLVRAMRVAENVALGMPGWRVDRARVRRTIHEIGERAGLRVDPDAVVADLSVSAQQRVEIVKVLARDPRVIVLDEPTAVLAPAETRDLLRVVRHLADDGRAVVLITHKLREALAVADACTVLRRGRTVLEGRAGALTERDLAAAMLGNVPPGPATRTAAPAGASRGAVVLRAESLQISDSRGAHVLAVRELELRSGEIVGIAGVEGSGHRGLLRVLAGRLAPSRGRIEGPARVAFVPADRQREALVLELSLTENVALREAGASHGRVPWSRLTAETETLASEYGIRVTSPNVPASTLSGGNQQRLVVARELSTEPALIVLENPTRGLDLSASASVRERVLAARARGAAVVLYSSDLDELLALADRVIVTFGGGIRESALDATAIGEAMLGLATSAP
jgi:simple sugar transport system ATP-binding protein